MEQRVCRIQQPPLFVHHLVIARWSAVQALYRCEEGGRDVVKRSIFLLPIILGSALAGAQLGAVSGPADADLKNAFVRSPLTCTQSSTIVVPSKVADRAKVKARLLNLLRESLYDDAKGIVNIAREKEIKKLANKLRGNRTD
jgi:hypothetical protein